MKIFLVGHFGGRNIGDEIILYNQLVLLKNKFGDDTEFLIYTYNENHTLENYQEFNIKTVVAFNLRNSFKSYLDIKNKLSDVDFIIIGGGGLIQDVYFTYGIFRYLLPLFIGISKNIPYYTFSIGASKISNNINNKLVSKLIKYSNGVSVRDDFSKNCFEKLNNNKREILQIPDSANIIVDKEKVLPENFIVVVVRDFFKNYTEQIFKIVNNIDVNFEFVNIVVFENNNIETELANELKCVFEKNNIKCIITFDINANNYLKILKKSRLVVSGRLHGVIPSAILHKDFIALSYAPKIKSFCLENNFKYIDIKDLKNIDTNFNVFINSDYIYKQDLSKFDTFINIIKHTYIEKPWIKFGKINTLFQLFRLNLLGVYLILIYIVEKIFNKEKLSE